MCAPPEMLVVALTILSGALIAIGTNWMTKGGHFKMEYVFAGPELSASAIVSATGLLLFFVYALLCRYDGGDYITRISRMPTPIVGSFLLIFLTARVFLYCRNQRNRAVATGFNFSRGMRNAMVGSASFTTCALAFQAWSHLPN
ncbi:MAG TPA: hypothetical protein VHZ78_00825 [Rhizomicrobium sp.]|jgi:hypothetical protein|nr:hypothetical protein [Rhizomicrobium sp.]